MTLAKSKAKKPRSARKTTKKAVESTGPKQNVLYVRIDEEIKEALKTQCFLLGTKVQTYIIGLLQRELSLLPGGNEPPPASTAVPGVSEVAPDASGKPDIPSEQMPEEPQTTECTTEEFSLSVLEPKKKVKQTKHRMPNDFGERPEIYEYARSVGVFDPENEFLQFSDYHAARGNMFLDWLAAWRTWSRNAVKYQAKQMPNVTSITAMHKQSEKMRVSGQIFGNPEVQDAFCIDVVARRLPG